MAISGSEPEVDTLTHLEERIQRAVVLVNRLRDEKESALKDLAEAREAAVESEKQNARLLEEILSLQSERQHVKSRLEKLLGHIDQLGAA